MSKDPENVVATAAEGKVMLPVFHILLERSNQEKISAEVFDFEIPVLKALHGEGSVRLVQDDPVFDAEIENDASSVLRTLRTKYNRNGGADVVFSVYRDADELASKSGLAKTKGAKARVESEQSDGRRKAK